MTLPNKMYFTLEEIAERWHLPKRDLAYLAENGLLRVSILLFHVSIERGHEKELETGNRVRVPAETLNFSGLMDLTDCDAHRIFRYGEAPVSQFHMEGDGYATLIPPGSAVAVGLGDLLIRRAERIRVEACQDLVSRSGPAALELQQFDDYRQVRFGSFAFSFGPVQAKVVRLLHHAHKSGAPWCAGKIVLADAGASCTRMADVFKSQKDWRVLIDSDRRGHYRLKLRDEKPVSRRSRAARKAG